MMKGTEKDVLRRMHKNGITWFIVFVLFFVLNTSSNLLYRLLDALTLLLEVMLFVTFVSKMLMEKLLTRHKNFLFFTFSLLLILFWASCSAFVVAFLQYYVMDIPWSVIMDPVSMCRLWLMRVFCFMAVLVVTMIFFYQQKESVARAMSEKLKNEKLDMELRYLKSQINPHFLFNALNNIYTMVYIQDENAANGVLKLSEMLRYVLVDCQAEAIPLSKEILYIDNFIDFQMLRMENACNMRFDKEVENEAFMIAPMLLQPIVENCFKYSRLETNPEGFVHLKLTQKGNKFRFEAENSVAPTVASMSSSNDKGSGIGQKNVRQRLNLYYGEKYSFQVEQDAERYKVIIEI